MADEEIIRELRTRWVSREEIGQMLGVPDRAARSYIEELNKKLEVFDLCIISTSSKKGYFIPDPAKPEDIELAERVLDELQSKAISIFDRRKAINNFLNHCQRTETQLSLF